jgi:hypothetical protein
MNIIWKMKINQNKITVYEKSNHNFNPVNSLHNEQ